MLRSRYDIIVGDVRDIVGSIDEVHCVVTSPPYFRMKKYGDSSFEIGTEQDVDSYISCICDVFERIPLHPLGSIWVNIGDKRKDGFLMGIPERFVISMEDRGFRRIDSVVWAKVEDHDDGTTEGNCMTEPAIGRLNDRGHEMMYRFSRVGPSEAWSDTCAVALPRRNVDDIRYLPEELMSCHTSIEGRSLHNVWRTGMGQTKDGHFASFHPSLIERPIAMTCPVCVNPDGTLPRRIVEMVPYDEGRSSKRVFGKYSIVREDEDGELRQRAGRQDTGRAYVAKKPVTVGWERIDSGATPGIVLDPFSGRGTTGEVALKLGRNYIGVDLYEDYCEMSRASCERSISLMREKMLNPWMEILG